MTQEHTETDDQDRLKIVSVSEGDILTMLNWYTENNTYLRLPRIEGIPHESVVVRASYSFCARAIELMIRHPSFDKVPQGQQVPHLVDGLLTMDSVVLEKVDGETFKVKGFS